ncbi:uncharacterized protein [Fopius arisanus]|uniref:Uncharacterized protein n=1 Tax=Fopius arisanus TaxID=64838 RepID=A0A9R1TQ37_9HYME|nr:PREDICTED: uncharacterized protein LOC105273130 [Fopius arisanus]
MSNTRGIKDIDPSKFNSVSSEDCPCPDTPTSSKRLERIPRRMKTRGCRSRRNVDSGRVKRSPSSVYEKTGIERGNTRETTASPVVKVTSVEVLKSWSRDSRTRRKDREKLVRDSSSNRSSSDSRKLPNHSQNPQKSKKSESCSCCDCVERLKAERLKLLSSTKKRSKSRCTPSSAPPQGSPTRKLCSMLKTRAAKRIIGCTCINDDWNPSCSVECRCPESPGTRTVSRSSKKSTNDNTNGPDDCLSICSCSSPERIPEKLKLQDLQPTVAPPSNWKNFGAYLKKFGDEYRILSSHLKSIRREIEAVKKPGETFRRKITRRYPDKEFSFEVRSTDNSRRKNKSTYFEVQTVDRGCQCLDLQNSRPNPKFRPRIRDFDRYDSNFEADEEQTKAEGLTCRRSLCQCSVDQPDEDDQANEDKGDKTTKARFSEELNKFRDQRNERQPRRIRTRRIRHDFSLPRIVPVNREGKGRDENRMMIYPPKDQTGCPLTLYKSGSFVNCSVEQVDDAGFKYDVSYVQRYVSLPWQPGQYTELKDDSTDDYG